MADISSIEDDIKQFREQLDVVETGLRDDPSNAELLALKSELDDALSLLNESLAELKPTKAPSKSQTPAPAPLNPPPPQPQEKWSRENHPAFKKPPPPEEKEADTGPVNYNVNDNVMAKWVSGDKAFYPARITSITGSSTAPIYVVKFKSYDTTEQLRAKDIRPVAQKRKADGTPVNATGSLATPAQPPPPPSTSANPGVISAAASINPELAQKNREEALNNAGDGKPKAKKIKAKKELEAGKNKWQDFNNKSKFAKANKSKKDSMFRTPEGVHGRVGFTGSGQAMRKDPSRTRHIYQANEDLD
ncbi:putative splicing factor spf30 protein [Rosellinia necatrix]|uniref:Putative splicing factor spf30 protein n=1 Tax=Rosellinia necatrix TaxID=77044 RepID=A0A1W2TJ79_ROSNE|nr:putative splicing factor spf30 protein [Rosellinia necatrix]